MSNHRFIIEHARGRGAPKNKPQRALTLVDRLYDNGNGILTLDEWKAADTRRDLYLKLTPASEGVSFSGLSPGGRAPTRKADRRAKYQMGN